MILTISTNYDFNDSIGGTYSDFSDLKKPINYFDIIMECVANEFYDGYAANSGDWHSLLYENFSSFAEEINKTTPKQRYWKNLALDILVDLEEELEKGTFEKEILQIEVFLNADSISSIVTVSYDDSRVIEHIRKDSDRYKN